jgi:DNA-binding MarR family transcriptional regulator
MKDLNLPQSNIELLISKVNHSMVLIRKKELTKYHIAPRQLYVLHVIHALGSMATASTVAFEVDREVHVINKLLISLEKAGLIKRIKNTPKSQLLSLDLTPKGLDMIKINYQSKSIEDILNFLSKQDYQYLESILNSILIKLNENALCDKNGPIAEVQRGKQ